jgi:hypothetical protein
MFPLFSVLPNFVNQQRMRILFWTVVLFFIYYHLWNKRTKKIKYKIKGGESFRLLIVYPADVETIAPTVSVIYLQSTFFSNVSVGMYLIQCSFSSIKRIWTCYLLYRLNVHTRGALKTLMRSSYLSSDDALFRLYDVHTTQHPRHPGVCVCIRKRWGITGSKGAYQERGGMNV